ncbi:N-acetylglucosamine-6-phosphate deacetylase [Arthrobacter sp. Hiyo6]|nr:N-acetylglucosamine-6-phosphate deacetylase [Arthrobacter sp. Hiyo6]
MNTSLTWGRLPDSQELENRSKAAWRAGEFILLPGLVDLHCHGGGGSDFSEGSAQAARSAARFLHGTGTTTLLASLVTASSGAMLRNLHAIRSVVEEGLIAGAHLEGPFLSPHQHGAHDPALLREPDPVLLSELLAAAGSTLASMTCAAELPGMLELVDQLTARGVVPSLGHTEADAATAADFLQRAALGLSRGTNSATGPAVRPTVTHLFNAMAPLHHRSPGPVAASLTQARAGRAVVELIADGVHLAADTVRMVFDLVGADNIALVTDSMAATGLGDGRYTLGSLTVTVHQGVARLERTGVIAGGTATLLDVVRAAVASGVPLQDAVRSASAVPASVLGLSRQVGDLQKGMRADVVIVDADLALAGVLRQGRWVRQLGP